jgi:3-methyladenine DNA glycosylase AlkD
MTLMDAMARLKALGNEKMFEQNRKLGAGENQFGINLSHIRTLAKEIKANPSLAKELWATGNADARLLAVLLLKPKEVSFEEYDAMMSDVEYFKISDWLQSYVVKLSPHKVALGDRWRDSGHEMSIRAGWYILAEQVDKSDDVPCEQILDRIENEIKGASFRIQEAMNYCLVVIGFRQIHMRARAIGIAEATGVFRDYPVPKGCTSPFAPIWIDYLVTHS